MTANIGTVDRILRIVVGLVLIALVFVGPQTPWGWIGVVPLLTALIGFCPAYAIFGFNTCSKK
jgi:ABC-type polysaccharide/polyol phosphate export permease